MASGKDSAGSKPGIPFIKNYFINGKSYVTWLNELCQKWTLNHNVAKFDYIEATPGIVGSNRFVSECTIFHELKPISVIGRGESKKMAQQTSAYNMLNKLELTVTSLAGASKPVELLNQLALANETGTLTEKAMVDQQARTCRSSAKFPLVASSYSSTSTEDSSPSSERQSNFKKLAEEAELETVKKLLAEQNVQRQRIQQTGNSVSNCIKIRTDQNYTTEQTNKIIRALAGDTMDNLMRDNVPFDSSIQIIEAIAADAQKNGARVELQIVPVVASEDVPCHMSLARFVLDDHALVYPGEGETPDIANEVAATRMARSLHHICSSNRWV